MLSGTLAPTIAAVRGDGRQRDTRCPAHDDGRASLSVGRGDDGRLLLHCHAGCTLDAILAGAGLVTGDLFPETTGTTKPQIITTYRYYDEGGAHVYDVCRFHPKDFRQRRADGVWSLNGVRRVLYHLDKLQGQATAYIVEGEKDADRLRAIGLPGTCNPGGAGKWRDEYAQQLHGATVERVVILPDHDEPGRLHAATVARSCTAAGLTAKIVALPDLRPKGDISDWLDAGHTRDDLAALVTSATICDPATGPADPLALTALAPEDEREQRIQTAMERERARREAKRRLDAEERPAVAPPSIDTLRARLARPRIVTPWRIEGWQPQGSRVMLAAQFKAGKTTLVGNMIRSKADGDPFLGQYRVAPLVGNIVLIDFEMGETQLDDWLRAQGIRNDDRVVVIPLRGKASTFDIIDAEVRGEWVRRLQAHDCHDLTIDCLRPILDALGLDEQREAGRFLTAFDALLSEAGIGNATVVHHMGHTAERSRGDSRLRDWPDVEWRLLRQDENPSSPRFITAYGRDVSIPESQITFDVETRRLTIAGGSRQDAKSSGALDEILAELAKAPAPMSGRAIKKH